MTQPTVYTTAYCWWIVRPSLKGCEQWYKICVRKTSGFEVLHGLNVWIIQPTLFRRLNSLAKF